MGVDELCDGLLVGYLSPLGIPFVCESSSSSPGPYLNFGVNNGSLRFLDFFPEKYKH